jgi:hypothetical protein
VKKLVFFFVLLRKTQKNTRSFTTFRVEINVLNIIKGRSSLFSEDFKRSDHETYNYEDNPLYGDATFVRKMSVQMIDISLHQCLYNSNLSSNCTKGLTYFEKKCFSLLGKRVSSGPNPLLKDSRKDFELI